MLKKIVFNFYTPSIKIENLMHFYYNIVANFCIIFLFLYYIFFLSTVVNMYHELYITLYIKFSRLFIKLKLSYQYLFMKKPSKKHENINFYLIIF
jgi:hypothetical protein